MWIQSSLHFARHIVGVSTCGFFSTLLCFWFSKNGNSWWIQLIKIISIVDKLNSQPDSSTNEQLMLNELWIMWGFTISTSTKAKVKGKFAEKWPHVWFQWTSGKRGLPGLLQCYLDLDPEALKNPVACF